MELKELSNNSALWLSGAADVDGMVVSCRARLARNLATPVFAAKATEADQDYVIEKVTGAAQGSRHLRDAIFFKMTGLDKSERRLLVERHLISPALADGAGQRGLLFNREESLSVMINEEDHLRLQAILPGLQPEAAWRQVDAMDDSLAARLDYAYSEEWGYLTACPTNVGTGLRMSVLIHLPALVLADDMERILRGLAQMSFTVRGFYGEGTNALGNLFQISNQATLGRSEEEIGAHLTELTQKLVESERDAQDSLLREARSQVEDKIWRAYGILAHARVLSSQEFMNLLSAVRLGHTLGLIKELPSSFMNQLMIVTQPSHLQAAAGHELEPEERNVIRAGIVRQHMEKYTSNNQAGTA